jgi:hypothetical protein
MRSLWQFLHLMCVALTLGASMGSAKALRVGIRGETAAVALGLAPGVAGAVIMWKMGRVVFAHILPLPEPQREHYARRVYIGAILWVLLTVTLGGWCSHALLSHIS